MLEDVTRHSTIAFGASGDVVVLLGANTVAGDVSALGASEYLEQVHGLVEGRPEIDMAAEAHGQLACRRLIADGVVPSAHDCSDGGLAVALAECCIAGGVGFSGDFCIDGRWDAALFGETQSRIVVSLPEDRLPLLSAICDDKDKAKVVPWMPIGRAGGSEFEVAGLIVVPVAELDDTWRNALERALHP